MIKTIGSYTLTREHRGWVYRHYTGAGATGHHRNPYRAYQVFTRFLEKRWQLARARFISSAA